MGTPVPSRKVEIAVKNCVDPNKIETRQLTEEERRYYDSLTSRNKKLRNFKLDTTETTEEREPITISERVIYEMANKIDPPAKDVLINALAEQTGKSKALKNAASKFAVSIATVYVWIKDYDIQFDADGKVIRSAEETPEVIIQEAEHENCSGKPDTNTNEFNEVIQQESGHPVYISEGINSEASLDQVNDFVLLNKVYRFGELDIDIQYDKSIVVIVDTKDSVEISLSFEKVKKFAGNLLCIGAELIDKEEEK